MKKVILICCVLIFTISFIAAYAQEEEIGTGGEFDKEDVSYQKCPANKLGRGLINTLTCWTEIPAEVAKISKEKDPLVGTTVGFLRGSFLTLKRGLNGLLDVATFAFPPYDKPKMQPEYAIERADKYFKDYLW